MMNNMMSFYAKISIFDFYESHIIVYFTVQINYKFQEPGRPHLTKKPIEFKIVYYHLHSLFAVSCIFTYKAWFPEHNLTYHASVHMTLISIMKNYTSLSVLHVQNV